VVQGPATAASELRPTEGTVETTRESTTNVRQLERLGKLAVDNDEAALREFLRLRSRGGDVLARLDLARLEGVVIPELVEIPAGTDVLGSPPDEDGRWRNEHQIEVTIENTYWMASAPVTQSEYAAVMGKNPSHFQQGDNPLERPVECVSWYDAIEYCNALSERCGLPPAYIGDRQQGYLWKEGPGFRIPSEVEWEYAARAGSDGARYEIGVCDRCGGEVEWREASLEEIAWFDQNSDGRTHAVRQLAPNRWGLYDCLGNVWEWCWDEYAEHMKHAKPDITMAEQKPDPPMRQVTSKKRHQRGEPAEVNFEIERLPLSTGPCPSPDSASSQTPEPDPEGVGSAEVELPFGHGDPSLSAALSTPTHPSDCPAASGSGTNTPRASSPGTSSSRPTSSTPFDQGSGSAGGRRRPFEVPTSEADACSGNSPLVTEPGSPTEALGATPSTRGRSSASGSSDPRGNRRPFVPGERPQRPTGSLEDRAPSPRSGGASPASTTGASPASRSGHPSPSPPPHLVRVFESPEVDRPFDSGSGGSTSSSSLPPLSDGSPSEDTEEEQPAAGASGSVEEDTPDPFLGTASSEGAHGSMQHTRTLPTICDPGERPPAPCGPGPIISASGSVGGDHPFPGSPGGSRMASPGEGVSTPSTRACDCLGSASPHDEAGPTSGADSGSAEDEEDAVPFGSSERGPGCDSSLPHPAEDRGVSSGTGPAPASGSAGGERRPLSGSRSVEGAAPRSPSVSTPGEPGSQPCPTSCSDSGSSDPTEVLERPFDTSSSLSPRPGEASPAASSEVSPASRSVTPNLSPTTPGAKVSGSAGGRGPLAGAEGTRGSQRTSNPSADAARYGESQESSTSSDSGFAEGKRPFGAAFEEASATPASRTLSGSISDDGTGASDHVASSSRASGSAGGEPRPFGVSGAGPGGTGTEATALSTSGPTTTTTRTSTQGVLTTSSASGSATGDRRHFWPEIPNPWPLGNGPRPRTASYKSLLKGFCYNNVIYVRTHDRDFLEHDGRLDEHQIGAGSDVGFRIARG